MFNINKLIQFGKHYRGSLVLANSAKYNVILNTRTDLFVSHGEFYALLPEQRIVFPTIKAN